MKLTAVPAPIATELATESGVITKEALAFYEQLPGLTPDEGINLLDDLRNRRSWNMQTYLACAEGLDYARPADIDENRLGPNWAGHMDMGKD
jgi:hypothetical protein